MGPPFGNPEMLRATLVTFKKTLQKKHVQAELKKQKKATITRKN
jgi:hypothetical protein